MLLQNDAESLQYLYIHDEVTTDVLQFADQKADGSLFIPSQEGNQLMKQMRPVHLD